MQSVTEKKDELYSNRIQAPQDFVHHVRIEVCTAVTMKYTVFWDVTPSDSYKNRRFGGTYRLHHQGDKNR
jgi:hypothetical protein